MKFRDIRGTGRLGSGLGAVLAVVGGTVAERVRHSAAGVTTRASRSAAIGEISGTVEDDADETKPAAVSAVNDCEVNDILRQISRAVEEAAAGVRHSSTAAGELAQIAGDLQQKARQFTMAA